MKKYKTWQWVLLALCVILMFFNKLFIISIGGLNPVGTSIVCVFFATILLMIFLDASMAGFLCILAFGVNNVMPVNTGLQTAFGHNVFWLIVLSGLVLGVLVREGILRRIAILMITSKWAQKSPLLFITSIFLVTFLLGCVMDVTVSFLLIIALAHEILAVLKLEKGHRFGEILMIGIMMMTAAAYGGSPLGHPVPIGIMGMFADLGTYNMGTYSLIGIPLSLLFLVIYMVVTKYIFKMDFELVRGFDYNELTKELTPMSKREKVAGLLYIGVVILWLFPEMFAGIAPGASGFLTRLGANAPLVLCVIVMVILRVDGKPLLNLAEGYKNVSWVAAAVVGINMLLVAALNNPEAGTPAAISSLLGPVFANMSPFVFVVCIGMIVTVLTCFVANMLVANVLASVCIALISTGTVVGVNTAALAFVIAAASAMGVAAPSASVWPAYLLGDGYVRSGKMLVEAGFTALIYGLIISVLGYGLGCLVM